MKRCVKACMQRLSSNHPYRHGTACMSYGERLSFQTHRNFPGWRSQPTQSARVVPHIGTAYAVCTTTYTPLCLNMFMPKSTTPCLMPCPSSSSFLVLSTSNAGEDSFAHAHAWCYSTNAMRGSGARMIENEGQSQPAAAPAFLKTKCHAAKCSVAGSEEKVREKAWLFFKNVQTQMF